MKLESFSHLSPHKNANLLFGNKNSGLIHSRSNVLHAAPTGGVVETLGRGDRQRSLVAAGQLVGLQAAAPGQAKESGQKR